MDEKKIKLLLREFAKKRDWEKFHNLKNLACALSVEASELLEIFQWADQNIINDKKTYNRVSEEVADILLYLIRFADIANIDLESACLQKIKKNEKKYPEQLCKGISKKYNEL
tara:strand:- start:1120 stop:1458 length:339 start_codon:yes stop_codon:yes gene_type:complete